MQIVHPDAAGIREAVRVLKHGGVIALPTETVYGLACDPWNAAAIRKIFRIKGRAETKPLQLIAGSFAQASKLADMSSDEHQLARSYWPGPLTLLIHLRNGITFPSRVNPKRIIGIRVTPDAVAKRIVLAFGHPIAATSANRSGQNPASSGRAVVRAFRDFAVQPDLLIDAGALPRRKPSTVARVLPNGRVEILREGAIRL